MRTKERVERLESEVEQLKAIVDGGLEQAREATVMVTSMLVSHLFERLGLDHEETIALLAGAADPDYASEDHVGQYIHQMRRALEFQRDSGAQSLEGAERIEEALTLEERETILRRAQAQVAFEKDVLKPAKSKPVVEREAPVH
jgi:hypothetical protein